MMYNISDDSFPAKLSDDASKVAGQWPLIKSDSIKLVVEIGQVYDRQGSLAVEINFHKHFCLKRDEWSGDPLLAY